MRVRQHHISGRAAASIFILIGICLTLDACAPFRLVSDYDEQIDHAATALQLEMDAHLSRLESLDTQPSAAYTEHADFYRDYAVQLRSVQVRAQGHRKNEITLQQLERMARSLEELRSQHQSGGTLSADYIRTVRELFNTGWGAVIAWEIAKKRGE